MRKFIVTHHYSAAYLVEAKDTDEARKIADAIPFKWEDFERTVVGEDVESVKDSDVPGWRLYTKDDVDLPEPEEVDEEGVPV
jgi:hypothetical protein